MVRIRRIANLENKRLEDLRKQAEDILGSAWSDCPGNSADDLQKALHELRTYQIELELQNEELRRVQEELMAARDRYVDLYDFAPVGYLTLCDKRSIKEANLTLADLLGEERKSLLDQFFPRFIYDDDQDIFHTCFRKLIATEKRLFCELRMLRQDGHFFWAKLECVPYTKIGKNDISIRIVLHDITETKRLEAQNINIKKLEALALMAGGIAHDFNNLLAVILGNLEMAEEDMQHGRPVAELFQEAKEACHSAADLTKQFLTLSPGGDPVSKCTPVATLIPDIASPILAGSNVDIECFFPEGLWSVEVDAGQIFQAIGNVITNARDAMPQGGVIRIDAENIDTGWENGRELLPDQHTKYVKIAVRDQGPGIPENTLPLVFDPYFTSKDLYTKKGLGLGLTVTYSIIKKHGGSINIMSQQDTGTTITICLPACDMAIV